jgi:phosphatidylinositol alpha-mannosyltransferase
VRIGIVAEQYYPEFGPVAEHVHHFAREARRLGHTVRIVTGGRRGAGSDEDAENDVIRIGDSHRVVRRGVTGRVTSGVRVGAELAELLRRERFDVVHVHAPLTPVLPILAVHHATGPVVGTFHAHTRPGLLFRLAKGAVERYLDRLDAVVAWSRAAITPPVGRARGDLRILPGGVDVERFSRGHRLRRLDDGRMNVLWVGRVERRNGLGVMLRAFERASKQIDARLIVVGDGPLLARHRAMVPRELQDDVLFAGRVLEDRPDWYATADVVCAPAQTPSGGVTLLEAMAAGKPVLASDVEGYRDVVQHGREGELLSPDDVAAWARALVRLAREPVRAAAYGERGRMTAQRHAWPAVAREILGLYRSVGVRG